MPKADEESFHIPDSIPVGKFHEPHREKKHTDEESDVKHKAGMEEVSEQKNAPKQNEGQDPTDAGLEGQPHGSA